MRRTGAVSVAVIVHTPELLKQMVREKPTCWPWAAFASVVFQRWAAVEERKVIQVLGSPVQATGRLSTGPDVARFITEHMRAADDTIATAEAFLSGLEFERAFGSSDDEATADAEGILRAAHHLGDLYERILQLAEECRTISVPEQYRDLLGDCTRFMNQPLQDFCGFVNDVLEFLEVTQKRVLLGQRPIHFERIPLRISTDHELVWSILDRLRAIE